MTGAIWQAVLGRAEELGLVPLAKSCEIAGIDGLLILILLNLGHRGMSSPLQSC